MGQPAAAEKITVAPSAYGGGEVLISYPAPAATISTAAAEITLSLIAAPRCPGTSFRTSPASRYQMTAGPGIIRPLTVKKRACPDLLMYKFNLPPGSSTYA